MSNIKYPIGIQSFEKIRRENYLYVDKTEIIHKIVSDGVYYFLSRPRRFGKSLLISTLEALFKGKRELFKGLAIDSLDWDWQTYEVLHLDLNAQNYKEEDSLYSNLDWHLKRWEKHYEITEPSSRLENRFSDVILKAYEISGEQVVILIDEYDKPLLANIDNPKLQSKFRNMLQGFYGVLKTLDPYIKFGMLTGVTRFNKVSIFSSLNNLRDLSIEPDFNDICGISESELSQYFAESMRIMANRLKITPTELHDRLKANYDGYHFAAYGEDIYNPFSLLNTFSSNRIGSYWVATGTTSSLLQVLDINCYPLQELENCKSTENQLNGADIFLSDPIPFFFQAGYLTIKGYDPEFDEYTLGLPNREVSQGFNDLVLKAWMRQPESGNPIRKFVEDVREGRVEDFMEKIQVFFAGIPYDHVRKSKRTEAETQSEIQGDKEVHYQNVLYVIMKLMGFYTHTEYRTSRGRIDMLVETADYIYVMEFKIDSTAEEAVSQIDEKNYTLPFQSSGKTIFKIGANFDTSTRRLSDWLCQKES
ncbi:MAG: ATP-binding protein [Muribaculaceae bacterium]|nr:ATP-binding protein [Muribaculaceae bacterium]